MYQLLPKGVATEPLSTEPLLEDSSEQFLQTDRRWTRYIWDSWGHPDKNHVRVMFKLDMALLGLATASTFVKHMDKANLSFAYVNGLKEDLGIEGNELNYANTGYRIALMLIGFPLTYLMVKMSTKWFVISIEILWIITTFATAFIKTPFQMIVMRIILGAMECGHYPALSYILGTYYTFEELARRNVILQASTSIGAFFAGYVASATYGGLRGISDNAGWRWIFIIDGFISLGVLLPQAIFFPDRLSNQKPNAVFSNEDIRYMKMRKPEQAVDSFNFEKKDFAAILHSWEIWAFWSFGMFQDLVTLSSGAFLLWLKALDEKGGKSYSPQQIDHLGSTIYIFQTFIAIISGWLSDTVCKGRRWPPLVVAGLVSAFACYYLASTPVFPEKIGFRFFLYLQTSWTLSTAGLYWAWPQEFFESDLKMKAIATGGINFSGYCSNIIANNIWFKTSEMPEIPVGHYISAFAGLLYSLTGLLLGLYGGQRRQY